MFFLNLSAGEFLALLGTVGGLVTALYLLDRTRRKQLVSTLRFWTPAAFASEQQSRKRVQEPWSLILQLASLLLLLLALARLEWGTRGPKPVNHVLLLDVSSATAQSTRGATLLDREKALARRYLASLSSRDRVMLVRANDVATPVTPFTTDHGQLIKAVDASASSYSALYIDRALSYARQALTWSDDQAGETVYVGPARVAEANSGRAGPNGLRVLPVEAATENCGIRGIGIIRDEVANSWQASVRVKNYGSKPKVLQVLVGVAGARFAPRSVRLRPGQETGVEYEFVTTAAGQLTARIEPQDDFALDDQASVMVPAYRSTRVVVYTNRPDVWGPLLSANTHLEARYLPPARYQGRPSADVMILDGFGPAVQPAVSALFVNPPKNRSPLPVKASEADQTITKWSDDVDLGAGLRAKDFRISRTSVFQTFGTDFSVASIDAGPVVVVRPASGSQQKMAVVGFDLLGGPLRFEVSSPLLFANLVRWLSTAAFRSIQITADHVGVASVVLDASERSERVRAQSENGNPVTFTQRGNRLQFYVESPAVIHVTSEEREHILSLVLPEVAEYNWKPPAGSVSGLPGAAASSSGSVSLWKELALLGALGLLIEWMLFGRRRMQVFGKREPVAPDLKAVRPERELVSK